MITTVCKISYGSQTVPPIVPAVQGDTGRAISFEIADFTPPAGATATYFILKPSGEAIYNSATITNNSILCELTAQSLAEAGENRMQVRVLQGEDIVTSFEVILMVRTFLGDDAIESGTEMNIFDQAVEQATEQFQENAEQIVEEVIESIPADYTELTDEVDELNERIDNLNPITDDIKEALLACFRGVAWLNWEENGESLYNALSEALNVEPPEPTPTFNYGVYMQEETINGKYIDASGSVIDGQADKSFYIPDYIPVIKGSYWIALQPSTMRGTDSDDGNIWSESNWRVSEYDKDKIFIKQTQYSASSAYSARTITFDTDTKYIRLGWYDPYSSTIKHFDIENPETIVTLPMESGDINVTTGQDTTQRLRIRTTGNIEVSGTTISVSGCPFADTWADFTLNPGGPQTSVYGVRCYNSNNAFISALGGYKDNVQNIELPSGTKYIRFIMQYASIGSFAQFAKLVNHLFTVNGVRYYVTEV